MEQASAFVNQIILERSAESRVRLLGVAVDQDPVAGYAFLGRFGPFDELAVGGGWANLAVTELVWNDSLGSPAVPQLIMLEREFDVFETRVQEVSRTNTPLALGKSNILGWFKNYTVGRER